MQQYHVLVTGFDLNRVNSNNNEQFTTKLRHYRYAVDSHEVKAESNSWVIKEKGQKEILAAFPMQNTMILVEEAEIRDNSR